jgi:hypothetical protein
MDILDIDNLKIIFKIEKDDPEKEQFWIKFCRQNSPLPIDSFPTYLIDYAHLDFTNPEKLFHSITIVGFRIVKDQLLNEPVLDENKENSIMTTTKLSDYVGKIVSIDCNSFLTVDKKVVFNWYEEIQL